MSDREKRPWAYEQKACVGCGKLCSIAKTCSYCSVSCSKIGKPVANARYGEDHPHWSGEAVSYNAAHKRVYRSKGAASAQMCSCGAPANEWANLTGNYADTDDYEAMCYSCHKKYDYARRPRVLR